MSRGLISRSPDLKRLRDEGYEVDIVGGYLVVHVPYVDARATVQRGVLAAPITEGGGVVAPPHDHTVHFVGEHPCNRDGTAIQGIRAGDSGVTIRTGMVAGHHLSNKPTEPPGYRDPDFYVKMKRYIAIICSAAESLDPAVRTASCRIIETREDESPFMYMDTASSRAGINAVSEKLQSLTVAIIGLGGTGSYILDLLAKSPLKEIRLFDDDVFYSHNAFRAPGAAGYDELATYPAKVAYYAAHYSRLHKHIVPHEVRIDVSTVQMLDGVDFAFICVDDGAARRTIIENLQHRNMQFIDVGMDVMMVSDESMLIGVLRVTTSSVAKQDHVLGGDRVPLAPRPPADEYRHNIQIADLNAFNAVLAVVKFKKLYGVYQDLEHEHHSTYTVNAHLLTSLEHPDDA